VTALLLAFVLGSCQKSDTPEASWVKAKGGNVNDVNATINDNGETLVHLAVWEGRMDLLTWLKERGADVNVRNKHGQTPIYGAAEYGYVEILKWLKEQGAEVNAKSNDGKTPLSVARSDEAKTWLRANGAQ